MMRQHGVAVNVGSRASSKAPKLNPVSPMKPREQVCPQCKANVGESCVNGKGQPTSTHVSRQRLAVRAHLKERGI